MQEEQRIKNLRDLRKKKNSMRKLHGKMKRLRELANNPVVREYLSLQEEIRTIKYIEPSSLNLASVIKKQDCPHEYFIFVGPYNPSCSQILEYDDNDVSITHVVLMCLDCSQVIYVPKTEIASYNIIYSNTPKIYNVREEYLQLLEKGITSCEALQLTKNKYDVSPTPKLTK